MKNIHVLPTDKPSRLWMTKLGNLTRCHDIKPIKEALGNNVNIYITSDEKIKEGDWCHDIFLQAIFQANSFMGTKTKNTAKKIILTTDQDLIKDGVQAIDDDFLEWFVKNPSCERVEVENDYLLWRNSEKEKLSDCYKIIIPSEEPTIVDKLKEYFKNTSEEQIQKDWDKTCEKTKGINSPTVEEFLEAQKQNLIDMMKDDEVLGLYEEPKQRLEKYSERFDNKENEIVQGIFNPENWGNRLVNDEPKQENCCTPIGQIKRYVDCKGCDKKPSKLDLTQLSKDVDNALDKETKESMSQWLKEKREKKLTAVEWLVGKFNYTAWMLNRDEISTATADQWKQDFFTQAKEMEKEQIRNAYCKGEQDFVNNKVITSEQYYNETYKK